MVFKIRGKSLKLILFNQPGDIKEVADIALQVQKDVTVLYRAIIGDYGAHYVVGHTVYSIGDPTMQVARTDHRLIDKSGGEMRSMTCDTQSTVLSLRANAMENVRYLKDRGVQVQELTLADKF